MGIKSIQGQLIEVEYSGLLVSTSVLIAVLASYASIYLASSLKDSETRFNRFDIPACAFSLGGGIWSMHFISLLAMEFSMPVKFGVGGTVLPLFFCVFPTYWALKLVHSKKILKERVFWGGLVFSFGVSLMHYMGIFAMKISASIQVDKVLLAFSMFVTFVASMVTLWLFIRVVEFWKMTSLVNRWGSVCGMGLAIVSMHFVNMAPLKFIRIEETPFRVPIDPEMLAILILIITFIILGIALASAIVNRRFLVLKKQKDELERKVEERTIELKRKNLELDLALNQAVEYASLVQNGFLPDNPPKVDQFVFSAKTFPAKLVGGDFYDFVVISECRIGILLGDVSGKGVPAALYMARLISDFRFLCHKDSCPQALMNDLNSILEQRSKRGMFATAIYLLLDTRDKTLQVANAGHQPLLIRDNHQNFKEAGKAGGIPLGIVSKVQYPLEKIQLESGNLVVLYTDGVTEPNDEKGNLFGLTGLKNCLSAEKGSPEILLDKIKSSIQQFTNNAPPHDDLTLLAFQVL